MGELLAEQAPVEADMVMGVPESGIPAAEGYARRSGIPYGQGLVKNRYIGRTFIAPSQEMRALGVRMKLNPLKENIAGQAARRRRRLDRAGHHARRPMVADAPRGRRRRGAPAHLVAAVPWPCFYGMDTGARGELLAANLEVDEIRRVPRRRLARVPRRSTGWSTATGRPGPASATPASPATTRCPSPPPPRKGVLEATATTDDERAAELTLLSLDGGDLRGDAMSPADQARRERDRAQELSTGAAGTEDGHRG